LGRDAVVSVTGFALADVVDELEYGDALIDDHSLNPNYAWADIQWMGENFLGQPEVD
jgi:hypothetical protein